MIVLLSCSTSWCQNDNVNIPSTGVLTSTPDSVLMVELKYEKEINDSLRSIVANDEIIMREYKRNIDALKKQIKQENRKYKIAVGGGLLATLSLVTVLIVK